VPNRLPPRSGCLNLQSPRSKGLFHRAINQSGTRIGVTAPQVALKLGEDFAATAGCASDPSAACLRSLSVEKILGSQSGILGKVVDFPSVDGTVITRSALDAFTAGDYNRVPLMSGLVRDEQGFFMPELSTGQPYTESAYKAYAASFGAAHAEALLKQYPLAGYDSPSLAAIAMAQGSKACTARALDRQWVRHAPLYVYQFDDRTAPSYFPPVSFPMRAYHTAELQYLFPMFRGGRGEAHELNAQQKQLSEAMIDYWTAFARTGNPNPQRQGAPPMWRPYAADKDNVQILDLPAPREALGYGAANSCDFWDRVLALP
jgi:para-nitrobenzyl esterase